jgi:hypothetical protein
VGGIFCSLASIYSRKKKHSYCKIKREENRIVRSKFHYHFIVFPYEFLLHMLPFSKYVLFSLFLAIFLIFHAWKVVTALFEYFSWRLVSGSVSSSCQELTHAEARGQLIIIMGLEEERERRLRVSLWSREFHSPCSQCFHLETADTVRTEDHNSQLIQAEGKFLDPIIKLAELSVILMAS